ncbi:hypothetical protein BDW22DRAFT_159879 [Trametopsis cervina]|nr:hypothetical protein BDW22DRAFT_159879 [Trametopsis cervina]
MFGYVRQKTSHSMIELRKRTLLWLEGNSIFDSPLPASRICQDDPSDIVASSNSLDQGIKISSGDGDPRPLPGATERCIAPRLTLMCKRSSSFYCYETNVICAFTLRKSIKLNFPLHVIGVHMHMRGLKSAEWTAVGDVEAHWQSATYTALSISPHGDEQTVIRAHS